MTTRARRTIDASDRAAVVGAAKTRNNGRYNGNGRRWETPPEVFDALHECYSFTIDACAESHTAKVSRFFAEPGPWAGSAGCLAVDGLAQDWRGERVWMNPPYGAEVYAWARKARLEVTEGGCPLVVGLLPASTDLAWWHEDVLPFVRTVHWYKGRVRFLTGGPYRASGFFPSVAVAWEARP